MRKVLFILLIFLCVSVPIAGQAPDDVTSLAQYFPADSPFFFAILTDDNTIDAFDRLTKLLNEAGIIPGQFDLKEALDEIADSAISGGNFETVFRPWLGDSVAIGMLPFSDDEPLVAFGVKDRAEAAKFIEQLALEGFTPREERRYTVYTSDSEYDPTYLLSDEVLVITENPAFAAELVSGDFGTLTNKPDFKDNVSKLPAESYGALLYTDAASLAVATDAMLPVLGRQVFGFALLDDRSFVIDTVVTPGDEIPVSIFEGFQPFDSAFAANIPADAQFVMMGSGFGQQVATGFEAINVIGDIAKEQMKAELYRELEGTPQSGAIFDMIDQYNFGGLTKGSATLLFAGLTGLNLEDDVLSWMTGAYAAFASVDPLSDEPAFDLGFVTEATDLTAAANVVGGIIEAAQLYEINHTVENDTLVISGVLPALLKIPSTPELDILLGANGGLFTFGTRPAVENVLGEDRAALSDSAAYLYAIDSVILPDTQVLFLLNMQPVVDTLNRSPRGDTPEMRGVIGGLRQIESASISAVLTAPATVVARFALTLAEEN